MSPREKKRRKHAWRMGAEVMAYVPETDTLIVRWMRLPRDLLGFITPEGFTLVRVDHGWTMHLPRAHTGRDGP